MGAGSLLSNPISLIFDLASLESQIRNAQIAGPSPIQNPPYCSFPHEPISHSQNRFVTCSYSCPHDPTSHSQNQFVTCSYSCPHELTSHTQNQFVTCFLLLSS